MKRCMRCMKEYGDTFDVCPNCGYVENTPPKEIYFLTPGTVLHNRFIVGTSVGAGGFGIVYKAWDINLEKVVAIKEFFPISYANRAPGTTVLNVLPKMKSIYFRELSRFLDEARYLAKFSSHPNILNVYSFFEENNTAYIEMEYLEGKSYKDSIREQGGTVSQETAINVTIAILGALKEIHKEGIIHRDISPDNIFICSDGRIKLMDFGAARLSKQDAEGMTIILKPGYAPPEQYQNKSRQGVYTDIYAVGAVLYNSLTGVKAEESTNRLIQDNLKSPRELDESISENLSNTIMRAMALLPDLRFQSDEEFIDALKAEKSSKIRSVEEELKFRKKRRVIALLAIVAVMLVGAFIGFRVYQSGKDAVELKEASITIWLKVPEDPSGKQIITTSEYEEIMEEALAEYSNHYPQITIEITAFSEDEYDDALRDAAQNGNMPTLYSDPGSDDLRGVKVSDVLKYLDASEYYGLENYSDTYDNNNVFPITFSLPALYVNRNMECPDEEEILSEYQERVDSGYFDENYDELESFLNEDEAYYLGSTADYWFIQSELAGIYEFYPIPETDSYTAEFEMAFCISTDANKSQYYASIQALKYLLGENAQTGICVENHLELPLNKKTYSMFEELNVEYKNLDSMNEKLVFEQ